jgi:hypothetical protein
VLLEHLREAQAQAELAPGAALHERPVRLKEYAPIFMVHELRGANSSSFASRRELAG